MVIILHLENNEWEVYFSIGFSGKSIQATSTPHQGQQLEDKTTYQIEEKSLDHLAQRQFIDSSDKDTTAKKHIVSPSGQSYKIGVTSERDIKETSNTQISQEQVTIFLQLFIFDEIICGCY